MWRTTPRPLLEEGVFAYLISLLASWLCLISSMTVLILIGSLFRAFRETFHIGANFFGVAIYLLVICAIGFILALPALLLCIRFGRAGLISAVAVGAITGVFLGQVLFQPDYTVPPLISAVYGVISSVGGWFGLHWCWPDLRRTPAEGR